MKKITVLANGKRKVQTINTLPTRTNQSSKDECDVNKIIAKYNKGQGITHISQKKGVFADLTDVKDYHTSLLNVINAQDAFNALPSNIRTRFGNNPAQLLEFMENPDNYDEGVKLGFLEPRPSTQQPTTQTQQSQTTQPTQTPTPTK